MRHWWQIPLKFDLSQSWLLAIAAVGILVFQTFLAFQVYPALLPFSYLTLAACFLGLSVIGFLHYRRLYIVRFEGLILLFLFLLLAITFINGTDVKGLVYKFVEIALLLSLLEYFSGQYVTVIKSFAFFSSVCVYVNIALMLIFPDWMLEVDNQTYFLLGGNYNQMGPRLMCAIVSNILCVPYGKKWILNTVLVISLSILTLVLVGSMTALSCIVLFTLACIVPVKRLLKLAIIGTFVVYVLFQCLVCFNGEGLHNNETAVWLIADVLHMDMSFTNRTYMWALSGQLFAKSPILGYGMVSNEWYEVNMTSTAVGTHNLIYATLIYGGIVLLGIFLVIWIVALRHIYPCRDRRSLLLVLAFFVMLFMQCFEVYPYFFNFYLLCLMYYYHDIQTAEHNIKVKADEVQSY